MSDFIVHSFREIFMRVRLNKASGGEVTPELLQARGTHICASCFISSDLLGASRYTSEQLQHASAAERKR